MPFARLWVVDISARKSTNRKTVTPKLMAVKNGCFKYIYIFFCSFLLFKYIDSEEEKKHELVLFCV